VVFNNVVTAVLFPHRVVAIEEPSVIIAASSEHRQEAISAVTFAIDALKSMATIWKKVRYMHLCLIN